MQAFRKENNTIFTKPFTNVPEITVLNISDKIFKNEPREIVEDRF